VLDVGFTELVLIAGVGLIVLGPERLPVVTRTVGALLGRAQRYVSDVKNDIQRQMDLEELKKAKQSVEDMGASLQSSMQGVEKEVSSVAESVSSTVGEWSDDELSSAFDRRSGYFMNAPERSWTDEQADQRVRDKLRARLRKRYHVKRARYD
jgi:sec-independent protein translocase protein TatB